MAVTSGHGNPKWSRDETILALDLYNQCAGRIPSDKDPRVINLSKILRSLRIYQDAASRPSFRNPDGVAFKLQNIRSVATGHGLKNVSKTDRQVWADLGGQPEKVRSLAQEIMASAKGLDELDSPDPEVSERFDGSNAEEFLRLAQDLALTDSERNALVKLRKGQEKFRQQLIERWRGCAVTGCAQHELLIASHIVPWSMCKTGQERLSVSNGLLLLPNIDKLFDRGMITFGDDFSIQISSRLSKAEYEVFGVNERMKLSGEFGDVVPFLRRHRETRFLP